MHLSTNSRKRLSAVISWRSKTLHLSTNQPPISPKSFENTAPVDKYKKTALRGHFLAFENIAPVDKSEKTTFENTAPVDKSEKTTFENTAPVDNSEKTALRGHWALKSVAAEPLGARIGCSGATGRSKSLLSSHRKPPSTVLSSDLMHLLTSKTLHLVCCVPSVCRVCCCSLFVACRAACVLCSMLAKS